jgi:hypothetical protein
MKTDAKAAEGFRTIKTAGCFLSVLLISACRLYSQDTNSEPSADLTYSAGLTHQHQDFFHTAFSFTGVEASAIVNHQFSLGVYGSTFLSNLKVENAGNPLFLHAWQAGLRFGASMNDSKFLHAGLSLNAGYVSIAGDHHDFSVFRRADPEIEISGLAIVPQLYGEMNATKWLKLRMGIAYDIYALKDRSWIRKSDLQNVSFNFGFIFGNFKKSRTSS